MQHVVRGRHDARHPVHVTLRVRREVGFLRKERILRAVVERLRRSTDHFRVIHFSVQSDHLHLLVEADSALWLSRKMTGLTTWMARRINVLLGRTGRFFADRYHRRDLRTPSEVRTALLYVLQNRQKHEYRRTGEAPGGVDLYSSAAWLIGGWSSEAARYLDRARQDLARIHGVSAGDPSPLPRPATWLARGGWLRAPAGRLRLHEIPGLKP